MTIYSTDGGLLRSAYGRAWRRPALAGGCTYHRNLLPV